MTIDGRRVGCVAWLVLGISCGPTIRPDMPPHEPGPVKVNPLRPAPNIGRHVAIGEMCPRGANDRPAVAPLVMRTHQWSDNAAELANVVERGGIPRFVVFGIDGKIAGVFDAVGLAEIGVPGGGTLHVASGTYVGASACTSDAGGGQRSEDPKCGPATGSCGLAVGKLMRPDDVPETVAFPTGGACIQGDALAVDIDGDNVPEQFPLLTVLDGIRSPANEWTASVVAGAKCTPQFQLYDLKLVPQPDGKPIDPKYTVGLDVLGVVDVDSDGRRELVLAFKFSTVRTVVVYTATGSPQRLELAGEATSFPR